VGVAIESRGDAIGFRVLPSNPVVMPLDSVCCHWIPCVAIGFRGDAIEFPGLRYAHPGLWTIALSGRGGFLIFHF
jgi:hypothetical protein